MQRMLVAIVLVLLVGVAYLGLSLSELSSQVEQERLARSRESREDERRPAAREPDSDRVVRAEKKLADVQAENRRLKRDFSDLKSRVSELQRLMAMRSVDSPGTNTAPVTTGEGRDVPTGTRDEAGNWVISEEEMEYFRAVQTKIDRRRRITGQTRNYMRRIESLVSRNEIAEISDEKKAQVETVLNKFVTLNDDLVTAYVRQPTEAVKGLDDTERREQLAAERQKYSDRAKRALEEILPPEDVAKVSERVFTNPWGLRPRGFNR